VAGEARPALFARRATGLVRGVTPLSSLVLNLTPRHPALTVVAVLFVALALNPGGSVVLAALLAVPIALGFAYSFGLLTQMIPRDGGDYMLVGRVLGPAWGLASSFCMTVAGFLWNAFLGLAATTVALGPGAVAVGLLSGDERLADWGREIQSSRGWQFAIGCATFAVAALVQLWGWRWLLRFQNLLFVLATGSLAAGLLVALFTSRPSFEAAFDEFARPYTGEPNSYATVVRTAAERGVAVDPGFSLGNTIPLVGVLVATAVYGFWSTFVGGELRYASTNRTARSMALGCLVPLVAVAVCALVFSNSFGGGFLRGAALGGVPPEIAGTNMAYFLLAPIAWGGAPLAWALTATFVLLLPLVTYVSSLQQTRTLFQYAFDGALPADLTSVNRHGCPWVALAVVFAGSVVSLAWAVGYLGGGFFRSIAYALLLQLLAVGFVAVAAVAAPIRRPDLYRASASQFRVVGFPAVQLAGLASLAGCVASLGILIAYDRLGVNADPAELALWTCATPLAGLVFYVAFAHHERTRGLDVARVYREIPPE
jgi:amino acid transporter